MDPVTLALVNSQKGQAGGIATLNALGFHPPEEIAPYLGTFPRSRTWFVPLGTPTTLTMFTGRIYYLPMILLRPQAVDRIGIVVTSAAGGESVIRLGIYREGNRVIGSSSDAPPMTLLVDAGLVDATTTGIKEILFEEPIELNAGVYWLAAVSQEVTEPAPQVRGVTGFNPIAYNRSELNVLANGCVGIRSRTAGFSTGTLPASNLGAIWPAGADSVDTTPYVSVRFV